MAVRKKTKGQMIIYKTHKTKDRAKQTSKKLGMNSGAPER